MVRLGTTRIAIAATATVLAIGCGRSLTSDDAGSSGLGGSIGVGGAGGAGAAGGAGPATDGSADQPSCVAMCGMVTGVPTNDSCTISPLCGPPSGFTGLVVFVDAQIVQRDLSGAEGWDYADASMTAIRLSGQACTAVSTNHAPVDVDYLCEVAFRNR